MAASAAPWKQLIMNALELNSNLKHSSYVQLATIGSNGRPANRTVVFRGFHDDSNKIQINTDSRSCKVEELKQCPFAESKASVPCLKLHSCGVPKRVMWRGTFLCDWCSLGSLPAHKFRNLFYLMADPLKIGNGEKANLYHVNDDMAKQITSMKLNGQNYLPWAHAVKFLDSSKKIWSSLQDSYSQEKNISHIYEIFEKMFATKQAGRPLAEYYSTLKGLWEELILYQPFSGDVEVQKAQREEFHVALLLYGLDPEYKVFKDQILAGEKLPTSSNAFSRLSRASVEHSTPSAPCEASALISSAENRGGSRSGSHGGGRSGSRGGGRSGSRGGSHSGGRGGRVGHGAIFFPSGRGSAPREDRKCNFCGKIGHIEDYCWDMENLHMSIRYIYRRLKDSSMMPCAPAPTQSPSPAEVAQPAPSSPTSAHSSPTSPTIPTPLPFKPPPIIEKPLQICWYFTDSWEQFRIKGSVGIIDGSVPDPVKLQEREKAWFASSLRSRLQYLGPSPGLPCISEEPSQEFSLDATAGPVHAFCLLVFDPEQVDYLNLKSNERLLFTSEQCDDGARLWKTEKVNP
ncbi:hypothetical protein IFM89_028486 [Coptis chinensis]|uniref:pyridoxal 5'-phosphate synthase n=1 Tax=Coptis chinensis TaxID=261450 RepID=A0A835HQH5_9MAGN|nr:hypothetical protein IFM89_028486 [Coptis chinensis]